MTSVDAEATISLAALSYQSLRDQALNALLGAIVMGDLAPGTHLAEVRLATELSISRGTLREALRQLQQEGLAVVDPRGRLRVREINPQTIREVFQVRAALEALAAGLIQHRPDRQASLGELRRFIAEMSARRGGPILKSIDADLDFHRALCRLSGNRALLDAWEAQEGLLRMAIMYAGAERALENMAPERHHEIVAAIEQGGTAVSKAVFDHHAEAVDGLIGADGLVDVVSESTT